MAVLVQIGSEPHNELRKAFEIEIEVEVKTLRGAYRGQQSKMMRDRHRG